MSQSPYTQRPPPRWITNTHVVLYHSLRWLIHPGHNAIEAAILLAIARAGLVFGTICTFVVGIRIQSVLTGTFHVHGWVGITLIAILLLLPIGALLTEHRWPWLSQLWVQRWWIGCSLLFATTFALTIALFDDILLVPTAYTPLVLGFFARNALRRNPPQWWTWRTPMTSTNDEQGETQ